MHLGALLIIFLIEIPLWVKILAVFFLLFSLMLTLRQHVFRAVPDAIANLVWEEGDDWIMSLKNGNQLGAKMTTSRFISPWMTVLNFVDESKRKRAVVLLADSLNKESFRQLRVRLRVGRSSEE